MDDDAVKTSDRKCKHKHNGNGGCGEAAPEQRKGDNLRVLQNPLFEPSAEFTVDATGTGTGCRKERPLQDLHSRLRVPTEGTASGKDGNGKRREKSKKEGAAGNRGKPQTATTGRATPTNERTDSRQERQKNIRGVSSRTGGTMSPLLQKERAVNAVMDVVTVSSPFVQESPPQRTSAKAVTIGLADEGAQLRCKSRKKVPSTQRGRHASVGGGGGEVDRGVNSCVPPTACSAVLCESAKSVVNTPRSDVHDVSILHGSTVGGRREIVSEAVRPQIVGGEGNQLEQRGVDGGSGVSSEAVEIPQRVPTFFPGRAPTGSVAVGSVGEGLVATGSEAEFCF
jgi:hypothetical protein